MKQRKNSQEFIYSGDKELLAAPVITVNSKRRVKLMEEDYIELHFATASAVYFPIGSYVDDELFGRFYVTEEQFPRYNAASGGYEYELKMEAWYRAWNLKKLMYVAVNSETGENYRKEMTWYNTNSLKEQLRELLINLQLLGKIPASKDFRSDDVDLETYIDIRAEDIPDYANSFAMTYDSTGIIDALGMMAETWDCEWWVTGEEAAFVIHFGRCFSGKQSLPMVVGDTVERLDVNKSDSNYGNKIYAFGGTANIPPNYRKELKATVEEIKTVTKTNYTTAEKIVCVAYKLKDREFSADMFTENVWSGILSGVADGSISSTEYKDKSVSPSLTTYIIQEQAAYYFASWEEYGEHDTAHEPTAFSMLTSKPTIPASKLHVKMDFTGGKVYFANGDKDTTSVNLDIVVRIQRQQQQSTGSVVWTDMITKQLTKSCAYSYTEGTSLSVIDFANISIDEEFGVTFDASETDAYNGYYRVVADIRVYAKDTAANITLSGTFSANLHFFHKLELQDNTKSRNTNFSWSRGGVRHAAQLVFGGAVERTEEHTYNADYIHWFTAPLKDNGGSDSIPFLEVGDEILIDSTNGYLCPSAYFTDKTDDPSSLFKLGENRLHLPQKRVARGNWVLTKEGYIIHKDYEDTPNGNGIAELVIAYDDVYPDGKLKVTKVIREWKQEVTAYEGETQKSHFEYYQYHVNVGMLGGSPFVFDEDYRLDGEKLEIRFLTPEDTLNSDSPMSGKDYPNNFKLAGMTFETAFNETLKGIKTYKGDTTGVTSTQDFCIVRNDDYSAKLPNALLYPQENDPCVLTGWNVNAMAGLGLVDDAENRLLDLAFDYAEELQHGAFSFDCDMMSDVFDSHSECFEMLGGMPQILGQGVTIKSDALAEDKATRIMEYEMKLDIPNDSPSFVCGETEAYSRLKQLEKGIRKLTTKSATKVSNYYSGSGDIDYPARLVLEDTRGGWLAFGELDTITCKVYKGFTDISDQVTAWKVTRDSGDETEDAVWATQDKVKNFSGEIDLLWTEDTNDLGKSLYGYTTFTFTATVDDDTLMTTINI